MACTAGTVAFPIYSKPRRSYRTFAFSCYIPHTTAIYWNTCLTYLKTVIRIFLNALLLLLLLLLLHFRTILHEPGSYPFRKFRCVLFSRDIFACYKFNKTLCQYLPQKAWCSHNVRHRHFLAGKFIWVRANLRGFQSPSDIGVTFSFTVLVRCTSFSISIFVLGSSVTKFLSHFIHRNVNQ